jgi:hypothetical protein
MKLTLGQAAKHASRAKGTMSKALQGGKISAEKDDKGRWQIDPSELQRWIDANPLLNTSENHVTTSMKTQVKMLREQMDKLEAMHERERQTLVGQVEDLKVEAERRSREHMQALAVLTDQREKVAEPRRRFFGLLKG